jgi:hypothetical protein
MKTQDTITVVRLWYCGDDDCECYQPQWERRGPKTINGTTWPEYLIECYPVGDFHSRPEKYEWMQMRKQFEKAVELYKPDKVYAPDWPYPASDVSSDDKQGDE